MLTNFLCIMLAIFSTAVAAEDIDDLIMEGRVAIGDRNYPLAENVLRGLLENEYSMNLSQHANVLYSLLELSYITKDYENSVSYGQKLVYLLVNEDGYEEIYNRILYRLCVSEDWKATRGAFSDICSTK